MPIPQHVAFESLVKSLMDSPTIDYYNDYDKIEEQFLQIKMTKSAAKAAINTLMISRAREVEQGHKHEAESANRLNTILMETYGNLADKVGTQISFNAPSKNLISGGGPVAEEFNNNSGQVANQGGTQNKADIGSMNQTVGTIKSEVNWSGLADDLAKASAELASQTTDDPEHIMLAGAVKAAEAAVKKEDGSKLTQFLKVAGNGLMAVATKVGAPVLIAYLEEKLGISPPQ